MSSLKNTTAFRKQTFVVTTVLFSIISAWFISGCGPKWQVTPLVPAPEPVYADSGMVVAAHPLASEAGLSVLRDGGNAVDAALAALFMLNVVEPHASGLGGGGFALVKPADGDAKVVTFRERAPKNVNRAIYSDPVDSMHIRIKLGGTSVCVPGAAAGWAVMYNKWHTLPLERLTRDAIRIAEEGFPVNPMLAGLISGYYDMISKDSLLAKTFLKTLAIEEAEDSSDVDSSIADIEPQEPLRIPYEVGDTLRQPEMAKTLRTLTERGLRSFYRGPIAEEIVTAVTAGGGAMTLDDLEFYDVEVTDPIKGSYKGYEILTVPPPSRGGAVMIEALNLFDLTGATDAGLGDPGSIHLMSQCLQQAYTDARFRISDPVFMKKIDWQQMLTSEHAETAAKGISLKAKPHIHTPVPPLDTKDQGNTTHLVVVDRWGNIVSLTQSINHFFGAGVIAGNTGILLNDVMADFSLPPDEPDPNRDTLNYIQGRKRPRSNMAPLIMLKDGKAVLVVGTPGGSRIPAAVTQIVVNIVDFNLDISTAIDYPRFFAVGNGIALENRYDIKTLKKLRKYGYRVQAPAPYHPYFGGAQGISLPPLSEKLCGAADKRRAGAARGY